METLKEMLEKYNEAVTFPFLGGEYTISGERNTYHHLRMKYQALADEAVQTFKKCLGELSGLDEFYANIENAFSLALENGLNEVSRDAISVECFTLDSKTIVDECVKGGYFDTFGEAVKAYAQRDNEILSGLSDAKSYRSARKATRSRWTSTTYGGSIMDAWGNQFKAGTMNAIEGAGHSIANAIGNMVDEAKADEERANLFKNTAYRKKLTDSIWICANNLRLVITNILNKKTNIRLGGWVTDNDSATAESMYNNLMKIQMDDTQKLHCANMILNLNPYVFKYYTGLLQHYFDHAEEILSIAKFFNITGLEDRFQTLLNDFAKNHFGNTVEDLLACRENTLLSAKKLGMSDTAVKPALDSIQKQSEKLLVNLAKERLGKTPEEINACRDFTLEAAAKLGVSDEGTKPAMDVISDYSSRILTEFVKTNLGTTENEAQNCLNQLTEYAGQMHFDAQTLPEPFKIVNDRIAALDLAYRTVNGVVLDTRAKANQARQDVETYRDILEYSGTFQFRSQFLAHIEKIKSLPIDPKVIEKYTGIFTEKMGAFDRVCKKAARYQYRKDHGGLPFWNGDTFDMGVHYAILLFFAGCMIRTIVNKETADQYIVGILIIGAYCAYMFYFKPKKELGIWNEVTHNGEFKFSDVIGQTVPAELNMQTCICPNCGTQNNNQSKFCIKCGSSISETETKG